MIVSRNCVKVWQLWESFWKCFIKLHQSYEILSSYCQNDDISSKLEIMSSSETWQVKTWVFTTVKINNSLIFNSNILTAAGWKQTFYWCRCCRSLNLPAAPEGSMRGVHRPKLCEENLNFHLNSTDMCQCVKPRSWPTLDRLEPAQCIKPGSWPTLDRPEPPQCDLALPPQLVLVALVDPLDQQLLVQQGVVCSQRAGGVVVMLVVMTQVGPTDRRDELVHVDLMTQWHHQQDTWNTDRKTWHHHVNKQINTFKIGLKGTFIMKYNRENKNK